MQKIKKVLTTMGYGVLNVTAYYSQYLIPTFGFDNRNCSVTPT